MLSATARAVPNALFGETVASLFADRDAIMGALDVILHGDPVGFPR